jgi:agmatinase
MESFLASASRSPLKDSPCLIGCPLDETSTFRHGTDKAPAAIRAASDSIETYSPLLGRDLEDEKFADMGDIDLPKEVARALAAINTAVKSVWATGATPICIGGEHTITLPAVEAALEYHPDLVLIHLDAHTDLRDEYEGQKLNHATVIRRIVERIAPKRLIQLGIRSGTRDEYDWMLTNETLMRWSPQTARTLWNRVGDSPVYLTIDLDVLDPSIMPATGNPEAGGWSYKNLETFLWQAGKMNLIAADLVELNPGLDSTGSSTITAAKILRELLLLFGKKRI